MQRPQIKTISDLNSYLTTLETRLSALERENMGLKNMVNHISHNVASLPNETVRLPRTGLVSKSFFKRSFTVWGHYFFAQLLIAIFIAIGYAVVVLAILGISSYLNP
ncbi:MAG: hypothetical protein CVU46_14490 [Chloroflexi bacterium HGW-Chloroflexi-8]|jgi:hypothetical protein|nr:MAG: hypothetical protein CVU46_14490 [Chloroflexi bacterium HGW-Chloroflexi-8]